MVDPLDDSGIRPLVGPRPIKRDNPAPAKRRSRPEEAEAEEQPKPRKGKRLGGHIDERC